MSLNPQSLTAVPGSLKAAAIRDDVSIAESFLSADHIILVDVSGSMVAEDSHGGRRRFDVACWELAKLQQDLPGKIAVFSFSNRVQFVPAGVPIFERGGTDLTAALTYVKIADGTVSFVVVSDGLPDDEQSALAIAATFESKIDTVYVGPETDRSGADFLRKLAQAAGGKSVVADRVQDLATKTEKLLLGR